MSRGLLRWSVKDLAEQAQVSVSTIKKMEKGDDVAKEVRVSLHEAVKQTLLATGRLRFDDAYSVRIID